MLNYAVLGSQMSNYQRKAEIGSKIGRKAESQSFMLYRLRIIFGVRTYEFLNIFLKNTDLGSPADRLDYKRSTALFG